MVDDAFGAFSFAAPTVPGITQINGPASDDDDWGDFVESPLRSNLPEKTSLWVKPKGALPLSLFGENESDDDVRSGAAEPTESRVKGENGFNFNTSISGIGSDLNGDKLNFGLFGTKNNNHDFNGLSTGRDLKGLEKGNLSGLSSNMDMFAVNNVVHSPHAKDLSGLSSNVDLFAVNNGSQSSQVRDLSGLSFTPDLSTVKSCDPSFMVKDTVVSNSNLDAFSQLQDAHSRIELVSGLNLGTDLFMANNGNNLEGLHSNLNGSVLSTIHPSVDEEVDDDDDGWEFKDAYSESKADKGNNKEVSSKQLESSDTTGFPYQTDNGSYESIDFSSASNGTNIKCIENDFDGQNGLSSDSFVKSEQSGFNGGLSSEPEDSNEWFGNFQGAFSGNGLKEEDVTKTGNVFHSEVEVLTSNGNAQENETRTKDHNGALPLAFFGDEGLESDNFSNVDDDFAYKPSYTGTGGINNEGSNFSIHDIISNLYSQAQQNSLVEKSKELPRNIDEDFDDDSWEFKDASAQTPILDISSHLDFYTKLNEELSFICRCHLDNLKKARDTAASSGEDAKVSAIDKKIQETCKELQEEDTNFKIHSDNQKNREISLNEFLEVLHEPKFQTLDSKYQLSTKLNLAQNDVTAAIEALKHTKSKLNILKIGSSEEQFNYVSTWYKIISVCAQELKHGSLIWKQSIEKKLQSRMLSEPRGKDFIISLAEIYRVVIMLGASAKLYEPWILSSSINSTSIISLLEDCYTLWYSLRIEEALEALPAKALSESIKHIHDLDELSLRDLVFNQQVSTCRLSLLSSKVVPEMKMVMWDGETYFVALANLWANLVSCNRPELPHLQVAS